MGQVSWLTRLGFQFETLKILLTTFHGRSNDTGHTWYTRVSMINKDFFFKQINHHTRFNGVSASFVIQNSCKILEENHDFTMHLSTFFV